MAELRRCIGSAKYEIVAHEAPVEDFPAQPSQRDGVGRMCKTHWNQYTTALRKAALARKAADADPLASQERAAIAEREAEPGRAAPRPRRTANARKPEPIRTRPARGRKAEGDRIVEAVDAAIVEEASIA